MTLLLDLDQERQLRHARTHTNTHIYTTVVEHWRKYFWPSMKKIRTFNIQISLLGFIFYN